MKKIVFTRPDGGVSIFNPSPRYLATFVSEAAGMAAIRAKNIPADAMDIVEVDPASIPNDRAFRDAWRHTGSVFSVDILAARVIQIARVEAAKRDRARDLIEREMMGENVVAEQAALRAINVTSQIAASQSVAALKAAWPSELPR